ncbi:CoaE-domain-containing protein, partial [Dentipellis sp. KUC8613]
LAVVGLTGGIGTGKSTVSAMLKDRGIPIVDADVLAREAVLPGTRAYRQIVATFGQQVIQADGYLDRPKLGAIVFADEAQRKKLNAIVHPAVRRGMAHAVLGHWMRGERICVLDVPLLIESGIHKWVGKVVVVYCSAEIQLQRLMRRDGSTREAAMARLNAQLPITEKLEFADHVIDNSGGLQELRDQVDSAARKLHRDVGWSWRVSWVCPPYALAAAAWVLFWRRARVARKKSRRSRSRHTAPSGS